MKIITITRLLLNCHEDIGKVSGERTTLSYRVVGAQACLLVVGQLADFWAIYLTFNWLPFIYGNASIWMEVVKIFKLTNANNNLLIDRHNICMCEERGLKADSRLCSNSRVLVFHVFIFVDRWRWNWFKNGFYLTIWSIIGSARMWVKVCCFTILSYKIRLLIRELNTWNLYASYDIYVYKVWA